MHKSKGAEFDAVILPFLGSKAVDQPRAEGIPYFISEAQEGILVHPGTAAERQFWPQLLDHEGTWKQARRDDSYNLMYVALTRARYANYLLLPEQGKEPCQKESDWILEALKERQIEVTPDESTEFGHADWYLQKTARAEQAAAPLALKPLGEARKDRNRLSPSAMAGKSAPEKTLDAMPGGDSSGADFGTRVHACFEQISWLNTPLPGWLQPPESEAQQVVAAALQEPDVAAIFTAQDGQEVYNEQSIEAINSRNEWVSATIDRLILTHDVHGQVIAAHIIDFKTNHPGPREGYNRFEDWLMDHYAGQMKEYRKLIAAAFNLPASAITLSLISCPKGHPAQVLTYAI
jgi:ATP-dependent exoDNAse (exonuclease V) beta subunit